MRVPFLVVLAFVVAAPAWGADEPSGCDKFKWPVERERAVLTAPDRVRLASGIELSSLPSTGIILALGATAEAKLPSPPERAPKEGTLRASRLQRPAAGWHVPSAFPAAVGSMSYRMDKHSSLRLSVVQPTAAAFAKP
jgi:hypothetical protein